MDKNSQRYPLPKGPWTRNLDKFPKNFKEESILQYKDTSKHHLLGYRMFKANKITNIFIYYSQDGMKSIVKAKVEAAMKRKSYLSSTSIDHNGIVSGGHCECIGGVSGRCKHVFSILWQLLDYIRDEQSYIPEDISCTSKQREWGTGSATLVNSPLHQMIFLKPDPAKKEKSTEKNWDNRRKLSNQHSVAEMLTQEVLRDHVEIFKGNGLSFLGEVIEANRFKPLPILSPTDEIPGNITNEDYGQDNINIPFSVKWEHEFNQIAEEYDLSLMLLKHCQISETDALRLEKQTRGQNQCKLWFEERKKRLTSSKFGEVIKRKQPVNQKMINNIWPKNRIQTGIMKMGIENEKRAVDKYLEKYPSYKAFSCGLCVNPGVPFLAASPDRIVLDTFTNKYHVLEIKTLVKGGVLLNLNTSECIKRGFAPFLEVNRCGEVHLKKTHSYYFQGQMALTGLTKCHFMVDSSRDIFIEEIDFDENLWVFQSLPTLTKFYFHHFEKSLEMLGPLTL